MKEEEYSEKRREKLQALAFSLSFFTTSSNWYVDFVGFHLLMPMPIYHVVGLCCHCSSHLSHFTYYLVPLVSYDLSIVYLL